MDATTFTLVIPGKVMSKRRAKSGAFMMTLPADGRKVPKARTYNPEANENDENLVRSLWQMAGSPRLGNGPLSVSLYIVVKVPQSYTKKKRQEAMDGIIVPGKPDVDNVFKLHTDALNRLAFDDDKQIAKSVVVKRFGLSDGVVITFSKIDNHSSLNMPASAMPFLTGDRHD